MGNAVVLPMLAIALTTSLGTLTPKAADASERSLNRVEQGLNTQLADNGIVVGQPSNGLAPQVVTTQRAVTVIGQGQVKVPAELALLEFTFGNRGSLSDDALTGTTGSVTESIEERRRQIEQSLQPIVNALVAAKIPARNITLQTSSLETPKLLVTIERPNRERVQEIVLTTDRAARTNRQFFIQNTGAAYTVKNCQPLERSARRVALSDAQVQMRSLMTDLNVEPGELLFVTVFPLSGLPAAFSNCGSKVGVPANNPLIPSDDSLPAYDPSDPTDVIVRSQVSVTYAIQPAPESRK
jgi:uncharacterized protein YggE